jgi:hypothetical protein
MEKYLQKDINVIEQLVTELNHENVRVIKNPKESRECFARRIFQDDGVRLGRTRRVVTRNIRPGEHRPEVL